MNEYIHFAPGFSSIEEVEEAYGHIYDATTLAKIADCPRKHQIRVEENWDKQGMNVKMVAGIAVHEGLDWYYAHEERTQRVEDESLVLIQDTWDGFAIERGYMNESETHLSAQHLTQVIENYFYHWKHKAIEIYEPITGTTVDSLNLDNVLAARFRLTDQGNILLGESNIIMKFDLGHHGILVLAGKPDLPVVKQDGSIYIMDHKTTSGYLSDWWAKQFEVSNKMRGYMAMVDELLGVETRGAVINGVYVGKYSTNPNSKATKFTRYQYDFSPDHVKEALLNQRMWIKTIEFYREQDYFPQGCGWSGCSHPDLCRRDPLTREEVKMTDYVQSDRHFWSL